MSEPLQPGATLPDVTLMGPDGPTTLEALRAGRPLVVSFHQEDGTPTCTAQLGAFRDDYEMVEELGATFVAISADDAESHRRFGEAESLPFPLLADPDLTAARAFGVAEEAEKRAIRSIFVTDAAGVIVAAIPYYNPANSTQYQAVFAALGMDL